VIRPIVAAVMMVMMLAVMVPRRIVGAVLRHRRSGTAEGDGKGNREGRADTSNELHFCLLFQGSTHPPERVAKITHLANRSLTGRAAA
jgi:hypothetical protein